MKTLDHLQLLVDDGLVTTVAAHGTNVVGWTLAASHTVAVAVLALSKGVVVLGVGALRHTEWSILHMFAADTVAGSGASAGHITLTVTLHAGPVTVAPVEPLGRVTGLHTLCLRHEVLTRETQLVARTPAAFSRALRVTDMALQVTGLRGLVVLQQCVVSLGLHDLLPGDVLSITEVIVLQDGHTARPDLVQGLEVERLQGGLDNVES